MRAKVWIVVVLSVLLAGAFVADGVLRQQTEERIATEVAAGIPGVATQAPFTAEHAEMTAMTSADSVQAVLSVELDLSVRDGSLVASTTVLGLPLDVVLALRAAGRQVEVDVTGFVLAGLPDQGEPGDRVLLASPVGRGVLAGRVSFALCELRGGVHGLGCDVAEAVGCAVPGDDDEGKGRVHRSSRWSGGHSAVWSTVGSGPPRSWRALWRSYSGS